MGGHEVSNFSGVLATKDDAGTNNSDGNRDRTSMVVGTKNDAQFEAEKCNLVSFTMIMVCL